ncbi:MAG: response regulator [Deltaproteobacteria bacterium]
MSDAHEHAALVRLILDHAPVTIWAIDLEGNVVLSEGRANVAAGRPYLGTSLKGMLGEDNPLWRNHLRAMEGEIVRANGAHEGVQYDSTYLPIRDAEGRITGVLGLGADISERAAAHDELRRTEAITAKLIDTIPAGVVLVSTDGNILEANQKACEVLGLTRDELNQRVVQDFETKTIYEDGEECPVEDYPVVRCLQTGQPQPALLLGVHRPDRAVRWAVFSAVPAHHPDTGVLLGAIVSFLDVTESRAADEERRKLEERLAHTQKMEAIGRLAGGIAHDFNNLLVAILGHAEVVRLDAEPGSGLERSANTITHAAQRAAQLTEQLLGFARKGKKEHVPVDLDHTVHRVLQLLSRTIDKRIVTQHTPHPGGAWIAGDSGQIEQVLVNLALNACDAMPSGGELTFSIVAKDVDGEPRLHLVVRDTGTGIPPEVADQIFEPFFTTKDVGKGTGMGLAVAYGIARSHGGWLRLLETGSTGTAFVLDLPRVSLSAMSEEVTPRPESLQRARILLVDDEPLPRETTQMSLESLGHEVVAASDAAQAVLELSRSPKGFDVVLLDFVMPRVRGDDCFKALRAIDPNVRVIVMSGLADNAIVSFVRDEGVAGFLPKPFTRAQLARAVDDVVLARATGRAGPGSES